MSFRLKIFSTLVVVIQLSQDAACQSFPEFRTPLSIRTIFIARCLEYQEVVRKDLFQNGTKNCTKLWGLFSKAFMYKDPCSVYPEDYEEFIREADHYVDTMNKVMYWSGDVFPFVIEYSSYGSRYTTIRDQLAVYALDKIENWCGQKADPGINFNECPGWTSCANSSTTSFWGQMSKNFALKVKGTVHLMLNSSSPAPYRRTGIFAKSELTSLNNVTTPAMFVHLVKPLDVNGTDNCTSGTILALKEDVQKKGMKFTCAENEPSIIFFQCVINPKATKCGTCPSHGHKTTIQMWTLLSALLISIFKFKI